LGKISITIPSGTPTIQIVRSTPIDPFGFGTGFGTECEGFTYANSYVLGDRNDPCGATSGLPGDWFDTGGVSSSFDGGFALSSVHPNTLVSGQLTHLTVLGQDFTPGTTVRLNAGTVSVP